MTTIPAPKPHAAGHGHTDAHSPHDLEHAHHPNLAHHWDTLEQQFEAGKLGMWLFLATEVLLFGGLFCAYAVWRGNHPELFKFGSTFLNTTLGATNTAVLILSSLTMAWGVTAAQQNKQGLLRWMLFLTLCGAATFLVIKYFEYKKKFDEGLFPGIKFYESQAAELQLEWQHEGSGHEAGEHASGSFSVDHAAATSAAVAAPATHAAPPPATDHATTSPAGSQSGGSGFELQTISITPPAGPDTPPVDAPTFAPPVPGPPGLKHDAPLIEEPFKFRPRHEMSEEIPLKNRNRPPNTHMFFNIYFMMTGLHGIHVLIGMVIITWLLIRSFKGHFNSQYFTPVDLGGLYWHIVDLIWIFLFPLFYLI